MKLAVRVLTWAPVTFISIVVVYSVVIALALLNHSPLWTTVYNRCVNAHGDSPTLTTAIRMRQTCAVLASDSVGPLFGESTEPRP